MKIALAPFAFRNKDLPFNLSQIQKALSLARDKAQLVCFGEAFLQGFDALSWDYEHDLSIAIPQDGAVMQTICAMTEESGTDLLLGYLERVGADIYSSCALISSGQILHNYRRISQGWKYYWLTGKHYKEGTETADFLYRGLPLRIALCGDLWEFPERFRTDATLLWPVYTNFSEEEWRTEEANYARQAALAARHTLMVNSITHEPPSFGGAYEFRDGQLMCKTGFYEEKLLFVEVP